MNRVSFLIDGFNLYHSLVDAERASGGKTTKWLDIRTLCEDYLHDIRRIVGEWATLEDIYYFSAPPTHLSDPGKLNRHKLYMRCLRGTGVQVQLQRFKEARKKCFECGHTWEEGEEKETDVAVAAKLFEVCARDLADSVALMTGDTDFRPAVETCRRVYPEKSVFFIFPYRRHHDELEQLAPESFSIKARTCLSHQFSDPLILSDGTRVNKPEEW